MNGIHTFWQQFKKKSRSSTSTVNLLQCQASDYIQKHFYGRPHKNVHEVICSSKNFPRSLDVGCPEGSRGQGYAPLCIEQLVAEYLENPVLKAEVEADVETLTPSSTACRCWDFDSIFKSGCRMPRDQPWKGQKIEKQPLGDRLGKSMARWPGKVQMRVKETPRSPGRRPESHPGARLTLQSTWVVSGRMTRNPALELSLIWSVCSRLVLISC